MNYAALATMPGMMATLVTDEQSAQRLADCVSGDEFADDVAASLVDEGAGRWRVTLYFRSAVDKKAVRAAAGKAAAALSFAPIARKDWVAESLLGLLPVAAGRFVVHGAHDRGCAQVNRIAIEIEAAQAFGTGHHASTRGCLLALDAICKQQKKLPNRHAEVRAKRASKHGDLTIILRGSVRSLSSGRPLRAGPVGTERLRMTGFSRMRRILDLGTGSGVLAIAAARSLRRRVLATDIDALAVRLARDNARLNRAGALMSVGRADGVASPELRARAPFDLVFANILLAPLQRLAVPLRTLVAPGGRVVLAGLLKSQANAASAAYRSFTLERRIELDGWTTLVLKRGVAVVPNRARP
jgi:ribosomal protein L11 methyltransferase